MSKKHQLKNEDVRKFTDEELAIEITNQRGQHFNARSLMVTEKVEDHSQFKAHKRNVARLLTEQSARRHKASPKSAPKAPAKPAAKAPVKKVAKKAAAAGSAKSAPKKTPPKNSRKAAATK